MTFDPSYIYEQILEKQIIYFYKFICHPVHRVEDDLNKFQEKFQKVVDLYALYTRSSR